MQIRRIPRWLGLIALLAALAGLTGCGGADESAAPALGEDPDAPETFDYAGTGIDDLTSYTAQFVVRFEGSNHQGKPARLVMQIDLAGQVEPAGQVIDMTFESDGVDSLSQSTQVTAQSGRLMLLTLGDLTYIQTAVEGQEDACMAFEGAQTGTIEDSILTIEDIVSEGDLPTLYRVAPNEVINGFEARHYQAEGVSTEDFNDATVDVWVTREEGYLVRIAITDSGEYPQYGKGDISFVYDLLSFNQPVTFTPPEDCATIGGS